MSGPTGGTSQNPQSQPPQGWPQPPQPQGPPPQGWPQQPQPQGWQQSQPPQGWQQQPQPQGPPPQGWPQQPPQGWQQQQPPHGWQQTPQHRKSRAPMIIGIALGAVAVVAATAVVLSMLGVFGSKDSPQPVAESPTPTSAPTMAPTPSASPRPSATDPNQSGSGDLDLRPRDPSKPFPDTTVTWKTGSAESFKARSEFMKEQQAPLDGSLLTAKTVEQRTFIMRQRVYLETNNVEWTPQTESMYLAITLDACEASILNGHEVNSTVFDLAVGGSPLIQAVTKDLSGEAKDRALKNLTQVMIFGVSYVCQGDANDWIAQYKAKYGEAPNIW